MVYKKFLSRNAQRNLDRLDPVESKRIVEKLNWILSLENPLEQAKKLINTEQEFYRFRIGDYRAVFKINKVTGQLTILMIIKIAHRKEAYKNL